MAALSITAASVLPGANASTQHITVGAAVTAGQPVYKDLTDADKEYKPALNNTIEEALCAGIALNSAPGDGQPAKMLIEGDLVMNPVLTAGHIYIVGDAAGDIVDYEDAMVAAADFVTILGVAISTTVLRVKINASGVALAS